jgi:hypothetical protein
LTLEQVHDVLDLRGSGAAEELGNELHDPLAGTGAFEAGEGLDQ